MLNNSKLKLYVERAVSELLRVRKLLSLYYNYTDSTIVFNLVVSKVLDDDEIEVARIAQTELLADFPDGELRKFVINQYSPDLDTGDVETIEGERLYIRSDFLEKLNTEKKISYRCIGSETAEEG